MKNAPLLKVHFRDTAKCFANGNHLMRYHPGNIINYLLYLSSGADRLCLGNYFVLLPIIKLQKRIHSRNIMRQRHLKGQGHFLCTVFVHLPPQNFFTTSFIICKEFYMWQFFLDKFKFFYYNMYAN